jgi:hypothetical protein
MPSTGHFILRSNVLPPVTAGRYELVSEQTDTPFAINTEHTSVTVSAPRYTMPPDQILSSFPPANAEGAWGDRLPQIVLKRRTLPWERNPLGLVDVSDTPWLALVVVAEGEAELSREPRPVSECVTPGTVLRDPSDRDVEQTYCLSVTETVVGKIFPCLEDLPMLTHVREVDINDTELANGDDDGFLAVILANRLPVFDAATGTPVRYLACLVNLEGQLEELPPPSEPRRDFGWELAQDWGFLQAVTDDADTWVSGGATSTAFDIAQAGTVGLQQVEASAAARPTAGANLDGAAATRMTPNADSWTGMTATSATAAVTAAATDPDAAAVVRSAMTIGFHLPISVYAAERVLKFPVLAHWSFTTNEGATFETLMQDLDVGLLGELPTPAPDAPPAPTPTTVVASGHLQLDHRTRRGDTSQGWYRGPFVPHPADREQPVDGALSVAHSADHLRRVVPDGSEDLSYAAAFEIGRLLALSQLSVTAGLLRFRQEQFGAARLRAVVDDALPWPIDTDQTRDLRHLLSTFFVGQLASEPVAFAGPTRPVADPGRPIDGLAGLSEARLDQLVATGFGIDLDKLAQASEVVGVVAALADTETPLLQRDNVDEASLTALRAGLRDEVLRLAEMAIPDLRTRGPGLGDRRRTPRTHRRRDALDDLLDRVEPEEET